MAIKTSVKVSKAQLSLAKVNFGFYTLIQAHSVCGVLDRYMSFAPQVGFGFYISAHRTAEMYLNASVPFCCEI
jgi:hypothetical protein